MRLMRFLTAGAVLLLSACSALGPETPTALPVPTGVPVTAPTAQPTAVPPSPVPLPTGTATLPAPVLGLSGEIYVTRVDRANPEQPVLQIVRLPASCLEVMAACSTPLEPVPGFTDPSGTAWPLAWSSDGQHAAVVSNAVQDSPAEIMRYDPSDGSWTSLAAFDYIAPEVFWSPDGQLLAFLGQKKNKSDLYTVHPDGTGLISMTQGFLSLFKNPVLSGWVGKYLAFTGTEPDNFLRIYGVRTGFPKPSRFSNVELFRGTEGGHPPAPASPDGTYAPYTESEPLTGMSLGVVSLTSERVSRIIFSVKDGTVNGYAWSPKGEWLAFWVQADNSAEIYLVHPDGSQLHRVYSTGYVYNAIFSPATNALLAEIGAKDSHQQVLVPLEQGEPRTVLDGGTGGSWEGASWRAAE